MYQLFKFIHVGCAVVSILGFICRAGLKIRRPHLDRGFAVKILPHIVDTVLLLSAITLVVMSRQYPLSSPWVLAKIVALLVYICLGTALMRIAKNQAQQVVYLILALCTVAYIVLVAINKNPLPYL